LAQRVSRVAYNRLSAADLDFPLDFDDVADSRGLALAAPPRRPTRGRPLTVGWICVPPGPGSGGHTTMFRMVEAVEAAGHRCVLYLYDRFRGELARHEQVIRQYWPGVRAEIRSVDDGLAPLDAYVASAWQTAHVLAARVDLPTRRLYLIQDFEPYFYPQGSEYALAEDTYRFGFRCITVGHMLARLLDDRYGVTAAVAEFGCDTDVYRLDAAAARDSGSRGAGSRGAGSRGAGSREGGSRDSGSPGGGSRDSGSRDGGSRDGIVFYARPGVARRGYELGMLALTEFHRRQPGRPIHLFGDPAVVAPFPAVNHGRLTPVRLAALYNACRTGIALSFTNISLVPVEMLACGVVPVLSGYAQQSSDLDNPYLRWAEPTPGRIADALESVVASGDPSPVQVSASVPASAGWSTGTRTVVATIEDETYGPRDGGPRNDGPRNGGPRDGAPRDGALRDGGPQAYDPGAGSLGA
jgi:hypothetical protein